MSELPNLREYESDFDHSFEALSHRLNKVYELLDGKAHADGSKHNDKETILIRLQLEKISAVFCERDRSGRLHVQVQDEQSDPLVEYWCDTTEEAPKHRAQAEGGKHLAGGQVPLKKPDEPPMSQTDSMLFIANLLELSNTALETQKEAAILAYDE